MGQSKWAWGCALLLALTVGGHAFAEDANDPSEVAAATPVAPNTFTPQDAEQRIESALDQPLKEPLDFVEQPLRDVVNILSETYNIPIQFDTAALDAVAASPDVEVTSQINKVTLRSALDLMLGNAGAEELTYMIDKEVLLITTQEEEQSRLEVKVYRVDDLIVDGASASSWSESADFDTLIDIIVSSLEHESWQENGTGEGDIHAFPPGMLVVSQTHRVHEQLQRLLDNLRRNKAAVESDSASEREAAAKRPVTRGIAISDESLTATKEAQDVVREALIKSVDWQTNNEGVSQEDVFLHVLPNRIVVRHLPFVVRQVELAARAISPGGVNGFVCTAGAPSDAAAPANPGGGGGGRGGF